MEADPNLAQFFPDSDGEVDLYAVIGLTNAATVDDIRKAYRKLALVHHPDKHTNAPQERQDAEAHKFQQVGFAYAVLSDEKRRARYDSTGRTDEGFELAAGDDGWESYFNELFDNVTRAKLDEMKKEYQGKCLGCLVTVAALVARADALSGSAEERTDVLQAFADTKGDFDDMMTRIPHSTYEDEDRLVAVVTAAIAAGDVKSNAKWKATSGDKKAKARRKKEAQGEAHEAEELAKEMGVWDEFYGSGKTGKRKARGKTAADSAAAPDEHGDISGLQALIQQRQKGRVGSLVDSLAEKYGALDEDEPRPKAGKKRSAPSSGGPAGKRKKTAAPADIDDAEFERLQQQMFGGNKSRR